MGIGTKRLHPSYARIFYDLVEWVEPCGVAQFRSMGDRRIHSRIALRYIRLQLLEQLPERLVDLGFSLPQIDVRHQQLVLL